MRKITDLAIEKNKQRFSLTILFAVIIFAVLLLAIGFAVLFVYIFSWAGIIEDTENLSGATIILVMIGFSIIFGATLSLLLAKIPLKPINVLINRMNSLAKGNYKTRLKFGPLIEDHEVFIEISDSFNKLAEELENTEMLRSDFINNFSHEFKTPIVSIAGLAKLINKGDVTEEERKKYLNAIEEESIRLSTMATNVLNLTKVENQSILTNVTNYNLSEQIRSCVLLLENKWIKKQIDLEIDIDEYTVSANEELMKEVWINLVDNAVKFSKPGGRVGISITQNEKSTDVSISNDSEAISEEDTKKIFSKFYQVDKSHAREGNGVGLAIVKKIVDLHGAEVKVASFEGRVTFTVSIPSNVK